MEDLAVNSGFWKGRKVFITGHTGFKGGWLSLLLQSLGAEVTGYALSPPTRPSLFELARVAVNMRSIHGDIRDRAALAQALADSNAEIVIHLAAQALVRESYADPVATYATNVMGTVNLLDAVRHCSCVRAVVNVTSDKCYENREWIWGYRENEPLGGHDPYSSSKACAELVGAGYRNSYFSPATYSSHGVALASARAGNVVGGGDWAKDRLIPDLVSALAEGREPVIRNPRAVRPWQHVLDPLSGYLILAERLYVNGPDFAEAWNFGPAESEARTVAWVAETMMRQWGASTEWTHTQEPQPHETHALRLDSSKSRLRLNWMPRWPLETTLSKVIEWYQAHAAGAEMTEVTHRQVAEWQNFCVSA